MINLNGQTFISFQDNNLRGTTLFVNDDGYLSYDEILEEDLNSLFMRYSNIITKLSELSMLLKRNIELLVDKSGVYMGYRSLEGPYGEKERFETIYTATGGDVYYNISELNRHITYNQEEHLIFAKYGDRFVISSDKNKCKRYKKN